MAFVTLDPADIAAGQPVDNDLMTQIKDNEDSLFASTAGAVNYDIPNGDMELTDGTFPANWAETTYPGGTAGIETTAPINGSQSMKFVHPGGASNGGGYADSDYLPCGYQAPFRLSWLHSATAATMKNQVIVRYFDKAKVTISSDATVYDSIVNPTTATQFSAICNPPATARFYKVRLVGGESTVDVAGTALFDAVTVSRLRIRIYTPSTSSLVEILDVRDCKNLKITFAGVTFSTAAVLRAQVSADNGASYLGSAVYSPNPGVADDSNTTVFGATFMVVPAGTVGANSRVSGEFLVENLTSTTYTTAKTDIRNFDTTSPTLYTEKKHHAINTTTAYNSLKIYPSAGTFSGTIIVEELF